MIVEPALLSQYAINLNLEHPQETRLEAAFNERVVSCVDGAARQCPLCLRRWTSTQNVLAPT